MYVLEIETRDQVKRIENPRKARIVDGFYKERLEVMDNDGKWHTIVKMWNGETEGQIVVMKINDAIKKKSPHIFVNI